MEKPEITIVVPVFNRADIVSETIQSVINQDFTLWELILVDDGSTDESLRVLEEFSRLDRRVRYYTRPPTFPKGANSCRNFGFSLAKGKYVKWLDSDDILTNDALSSQIKFFQENERLMVCFGQGEYFNSATGEADGLWSRNIYSSSMLWDFIRNQIRWPVGGPLWKKGYFASPPFDVNLKNSQEWLMHGLQLIRLSPSDYAILDKVIYKIRRGNLRMSSDSNRNSRYFYNEFRARAIVYGNLRPDSELKIRFELLKQMAIFYFHYLKRKF